MRKQTKIQCTTWKSFYFQYKLILPITLNIGLTFVAPNLASYIILVNEAPHTSLYGKFAILEASATLFTHRKFVDLPVLKEK